MSHKVLKKFTFKWEADQLADALTAANIEAKLMPVPREYSSIITGIAGDEFSVVVLDRDYVRAAEVEKELSQATLDKSTETTPVSTGRAWRKHAFRLAFALFIALVILFFARTK
jgi:hypothetical protein